MNDHSPLRSGIGIGRLSSCLILLVVAVGTIGCDRVTKHLATAKLTGMPRQSLLADTIRLQHVENTGAFLGLGADWPPGLRKAVFVFGNGLLLMGVIIVAIRNRWSLLARVGLALFVTGGLSNLLDRVARGSVIDFLNVGIGPLRTGIFNVADVAILIGACLVIIASYRTSEQPWLRASS